MKWGKEAKIWKIKGKSYTVKEIALKIGLTTGRTRDRLKKLERNGEPLERVFDPNRWNKGARLFPYKGKRMIISDIALDLKVSPNRLKYRAQQIRKKGYPEETLLDDGFWKCRDKTNYKKNKIRLIKKNVPDKLTRAERQILQQIPAPSELERRVLG